MEVRRCFSVDGVPGAQVMEPIKKQYAVRNQSEATRARGARALHPAHVRCLSNSHPTKSQRLRADAGSRARSEAPPGPFLYLFLDPHPGIFPLSAPRSITKTTIDCRRCLRNPLRMDLASKSLYYLCARLSPLPFGSVMIGDPSHIILQLAH